MKYYRDADSSVCVDLEDKLPEDRLHTFEGTIEMGTQDITLEATFVKNELPRQYRISIDAALDINFVNFTADSSAAAGDTVEFRVYSNNPDYYFKDVKVLEGGDPTKLVTIKPLGLGYYEFTMPESNVTLTSGYATFQGTKHKIIIADGTELVPGVNVRISSPGVTDINDGFREGQEITLIFSPETGKTVNTVSVNTVNGTEVTGTVPYYRLFDITEEIVCFIMPDEDVKISAGFKWIGHKVKVEVVDGHGTAELLGGGVEDTNIHYNQTVVVVIKPYTGYILDEFSTDPDTEISGTGVVIDSERRFLMPDYDTTATVKYKAVTYTVNYDGNGATGGSMDPQELVYDSKVVLAANGFNKTGYTFAGWNTAADGSGTSYSDEAIVENLCEGEGDSLTLYAVWTANTYEVVFDKNGGEGTMANQTMTYDGGPVNLTSNAFSRTGYTFSGWATSTASGAAVVYEDGEGVENLTTSGTFKLYAVWTPITYTLKYDKNTTDWVSEHMQSQSITYDDSDDTFRACGYSRAGYTCIAWNTQADGKGTKYEFGDLIPNLTDTDGSTFTLYAMWTPGNYTVKFDGNGADGGTMAAQVFTVDVEQKLNVNQFTRTGYEFKNWVRNGRMGYPSYPRVTYDDGATVSNVTYRKSDSEVTLHADWTANTYTIQFIKNEGQNEEGVMESIVATYDQEIKLPANAFTRDGYEFAGWSVSGANVDNIDGDEQTVTNLTATNNGCVTLRPKWSAYSYTVKFNGNGADSGTMADQEFIVDVEQKLLPNGYTKVGYGFAKWTENQDGSGKTWANEATASNLTTEKDGEVTLYAQWTPNGYKVTFNNNDPNPNYRPIDHALVMEDKTYNYDDSTSKLPKNIFEKTGYKFTGWNTEANGSGTAYTDEQEGALNVSTGPDVTLYARWTPITFYYRFNKNASDATAPSGPMANYLVVYEHDTEGLPTNTYSRDGYDFIGWGKTAEDTNPYFYQNDNSQKEQTMLGAVIEGKIVDLYAIWSPHSYTVNFDLNLSDERAAEVEAPDPWSDINYDAVKTAEKPAEPKGYAFLYWSTSPEKGKGRKFEAGEVITKLKSGNGESITLYAIWDTLPYTVKFDGNGADSGEIDDDSEFYYDVAKVLPLAGTFKREGYHQIGWSERSNGAQGDSDFYECGSEAINLWNYKTDLGTPEETLFAIWAPNVYVVTFDKNDSIGTTRVLDDQIPSATWTFNEESTMPAEYTRREGYHQDGWSTEPTGDRKFAAGETREFNLNKGQDTTLYAHWIPNTYKIELYNNDGTQFHSVITNVKFDQYPTLPDCTRTGYTFAGWNTEANGTGTAYAGGQTTENLAVYEDATVKLYAQWIPVEFKIIFDKNSTQATGTMANQSFTYGAAAKKLTRNAFTRPGYKFTGWNGVYDDEELVTSSDFNNGQIEDGDTFTLKADWDVISYEVRFDGNGAAGSMNPVMYEYGTICPIPDCQFTTPTGRKFAGWIAPDGSVYQPGAGRTYCNLTTEEGVVVTLTAKWDPVEYTVSFERGDNSVDGDRMNSVIFQYDTYKKLPKNTYTKVGHHFYGWAFKGAPTVKEYADQEEIKFTDLTTTAFTLVPVFEKNTYTVSFETKGGTTIEPITVLYEDKVSVTSPTKSGYSFNGWYLDAELTQSVTLSTYIVKGDVTLYAAWKVKSSGGSSSGGGGSSSGGGTGRKAASTAPQQPAGSVLGTWTQDAQGFWYFSTNLNGATVQFNNAWAYVFNPYATGTQPAASWFYFDGQGHMLTGWQWIKGADGLTKCYYLNPVSDNTLGACLMGPAVAPDGSGRTVDETGAWVINGVVQTL